MCIHYGVGKAKLVALLSSYLKIILLNQCCIGPLITDSFSIKCHLKYSYQV